MRDFKELCFNSQGNDQDFKASVKIIDVFVRQLQENKKFCF